MKTSRWTLIALVLLLTGSASWLCVDQRQLQAATGSEGTMLEDTPANRLAQAERCVQNAPTAVVAKMTCGRIASLRADIPADRRSEFAKAMFDELDIAMMTAKRKELMAKHFTAEELSALADFYASPSGRSAWNKLGDFVVDMQGAMRAKMLEAEAGARKALSMPTAN